MQLLRQVETTLVFGGPRHDVMSGYWYYMSRPTAYSYGKGLDKGGRGGGGGGGGGGGSIIAVNRFHCFILHCIENAFIAR